MVVILFLDCSACVCGIEDSSACGMINCTVQQLLLLFNLFSKSIDVIGGVDDVLEHAPDCRLACD